MCRIFGQVGLAVFLVLESSLLFHQRRQLLHVLSFYRSLKCAIVNKWFHRRLLNKIPQGGEIPNKHT